MGKRKSYTLTLAYQLAATASFTVSAASPEDACKRLLERLHGPSGDTMWGDFETSSEDEGGAVYVEALCEGDKAPWAVGSQPLLEVPAEWGSPEEAVREAAQAFLDAFGGDVPDWLRPQWEALARALRPGQGGNGQEGEA